MVKISLFYYTMPMNLERHGTLAIVLIYIIAVLGLLQTRTQSLPSHITASLKIREISYIAQYLPFHNKRFLEYVDFLGLKQLLEDQTRKPLENAKDRFRAVCISIAFGDKHLVPLFLVPLIDQDPLARLLIYWAFDPQVKPNPDDLEQIRNLDIPENIKMASVLTLKKDLGIGVEEAEKDAKQAWENTLLVAIISISLILGMIILGIIFWVRYGRLPFSLPLRKLDLNIASQLFTPFIYMTAIMVTQEAFLSTTNIHLNLGFESPAFTITFLYIVNSMIGLYLAKSVGKSLQDNNWKETFGITPNDHNAISILGFGIAGYCMALPLVIVAFFFSLGIFIEPDETIQNTVALLMINGSKLDTIILLFSVTVLAPLVEEPLFRGFLFGHLKHYTSPVKAALLSGFVFALAHLSLSNLIPLWALGFTLSYVYALRRSILVPMLTHGIWNLATAYRLFSIYG